LLYIVWQGLGDDIYDFELMEMNLLDLTYLTARKVLPTPVDAGSTMVCCKVKGTGLFSLPLDFFFPSSFEEGLVAENSSGSR
jgi:hypothetical protein